MNTIDTTYIIGLDLTASFSQLSFYDEITQDAVSYEESEDNFLIPNLLFYSEESGNWYSGSEAKQKKEREEGSFFSDIMKSLDSKASVTIKERAYSFETLFFILLREHLIKLTGEHALGRIAKLSITTDQNYIFTMNFEEKLAAFLSIPKENIQLVHKMNSFIHFVLHQEVSIWNSSVGLFRYEEEGLIYYQMDLYRRKRPMQIRVKEKNLFQELGRDSYLGRQEEIDEAFCAVVRGIMATEIVSGIYLTGAGFEQGWMNQSLKVLCNGRRAFVGQNLFTKGVCYMAMDDYFHVDQQPYLILAPGFISYDVGIIAEINGRKEFVPIVRGGQEWFRSKGTVTVFLDGTKTIELVYRNCESDDMQRDTMKLTGLPKRPPKTDRIQLSIWFLDEQHGIVSAKDMGFGTLYPTSHMIFQHEFNLIGESGDNKNWNE